MRVLFLCLVFLCSCGPDTETFEVVNMSNLSNAPNFPDVKWGRSLLLEALPTLGSRPTTVFVDLLLPSNYKDGFRVVVIPPPDMAAGEKVVVTLEYGNGGAPTSVAAIICGHEIVFPVPGNQLRVRAGMTPAAGSRSVTVYALRGSKLTEYNAFTFDIGIGIGGNTGFNLDGGASGPVNSIEAYQSDAVSGAGSPFYVKFPGAGMVGGDIYTPIFTSGVSGLISVPNGAITIEFYNTSGAATRLFVIAHAKS